MGGCDISHINGNKRETLEPTERVLELREQLRQTRSYFPEKQSLRAMLRGEQKKQEAKPHHDIVNQMSLEGLNNSVISRQTGYSRRQVIRILKAY